MKLIIGLGNPGKQYEGTRHSIGFAMVNTIITEQGHSYKKSLKHNGDIAEVIVGETKLLFVKPLTFYNESGQTVRSLLDFYKLETRSVLVIHDELALPFGTIRSRIGGSHAGNNGIKSIMGHIGPDFGRIRIGILNDQREIMEDADFVLSTFNTTERALFTTIADEVKSEVLKFILNETFGATTKRVARKKN